MADDWRTLDTLQRDLSDLKRQVSTLAGSVAALSGAQMSDAMRVAGRQASQLSDEAQRAVREHPVAAGAMALAVLGAIVCLVMYGSENRSRWHR